MPRHAGWSQARFVMNAYVNMLPSLVSGRLDMSICGTRLHFFSAIALSLPHDRVPNQIGASPVCASPVPYCVTCRLGVAGKDWETNWVYYKGSRQWLFPPDPTRFSDSDYTDFCLKKVCFFNPFVFYHDRLLACICAYVHAHANAHACACLHMRACRLQAIGYKFCPNYGGACDGEVGSYGPNHKGPRWVWDQADGWYFDCLCYK